MSGFGRGRTASPVFYLTYQDQTFAMLFYRFTLLSLAFCFPHLLSGYSYAAIITFGSGGNMFNMTFEEIGNPGNDNDATGVPNAAGNVDYTFQMGKFEVSEDMITRFNASQDLQITKDSRGPNVAATNVSWNEAARFVNWLNTSTGHQAAYNFSTGGVNDNIALWSSDEAWQLGGENLFRHKDAQYWLPSSDEWYKAAYYDPITSTYRDYASLNGALPTPVRSGTDANTAVYRGGGYRDAVDITEAGGLNAYGIMAMTGNAYDWLETVGHVYGVGNTDPTLRRARRGGYFNSSAQYIGKDYESRLSPFQEGNIMGFRVAGYSSSAATVPEPSALAVWALMGVTTLFYRMRWARNQNQRKLRGLCADRTLSRL